MPQTWCQKGASKQSTLEKSGKRLKSQMKSYLKKYLTPVKYVQNALSRNRNRKQGKIKGATSRETKTPLMWNMAPLFSFLRGVEAVADE